MSILIFLGVLFVLVLVHELGHFAVAKWTKMRVDEFGIGFPPRILSVTKGETRYSFNLFPIGGFVKIFGEDMETVDTQQNDASSRSFTSKSKWAQAAVLVAGITMNILFAWLLVAIAFGIGVQSAVSEEDATENAKLTITSILPGSPAEEAKLLPGTVITGVEAGESTMTTLTPSEFTKFIDDHGGETITLSYTRAGESGTADVTPKAGVIESELEQPAIGVALAQVDILKRSFVESITDSFMFVVLGLRDIAVGIATLLYDSVRLDADFSQIAGPVGIVGLVGEASSFGVTSLLIFTAFISLNLAVINILPFPALDGGRLLFVIIEAVKGSPISPRYASTLNTIGFSLLILLMIAVTWNDIARLI